METSIKNDAMTTSLPAVLPIVPAIDVTVFPNMIIPLLVLDERIIYGIEQAMQTEDNLILLLSAKTDTKDEIKEIDTQHLHNVGTVASIMRMIKVPEGGVKILIQGVCRARVQDMDTDSDILSAQIEHIPFTTEESDELDALVKNIKEIAEQLSTASHMFSPDFYAILSKMQHPEKIAEFILSHFELPTSIAQNLLERNNIYDLLEGIYEQLHKEIAVAKVQEQIRNKTRESINKSQNEYYLREQLKTIRKELGDDSSEELEELKTLLAEKNIPQETKQDLEKQLKRLENMAPESMEATVTRNHLEWILQLPWGEHTQDNLDLHHAKQVLDEDHHGLEDIKDRILEFIAIRSLQKDAPSPILCFTGPPGVGKTSLGKSIARSLGRAFQRISLGGVRDESEIRGHRKTYVGAMPGRIMQAIKKAGSCNPVILIDELDKMGADFKGDPSSAMLEVLDPAQNKEFYDNYLGVPFDLSRVMFVATSNDISQISGPLRDRMEIINVSGYTTEEKLNIAKKYLVQRALEETGLPAENVHIADDVLTDIILHYTRESGVRKLTQVIKRLCSKAARHFVENNEIVSVTKETIEEYLGPRIFLEDYISKDNLTGITNGLAWTAHGGEILKIEAILMHGSGKLILTGQLGDVMKESAQAALSYARAHSERFKISPDKFTKYDLHIHVPAGAIPKDGPSAGVTMLTSILSALTGKKVDANFAMTGELNLRGDVMPIGGVKEKVLAAKRHGISTIILPEQNKAEFKKYPELAKDVTIIWAKHADDFLNSILLDT